MCREWRKMCRVGEDVQRVGKMCGEWRKMWDEWDEDVRRVRGDLQKVEEDVQKMKMVWIVIHFERKTMCFTYQGSLVWFSTPSLSGETVNTGLIFLVVSGMQWRIQRWGFQPNPPWSPNYFRLMGKSGKKWVKQSNQTPLYNIKFEPPVQKSWMDLPLSHFPQKGLTVLWW